MRESQRNGSLLKSHAVKEELSNVIVLERLDGPVGEAGELLGDGLDPNLDKRELPANGSNGEDGAVLNMSH